MFEGVDSDMDCAYTEFICNDTAFVTVLTFQRRRTLR